jgi:hypothetical protein
MRETALICISHNLPNADETVEPAFLRRVCLTLHNCSEQEQRDGGNKEQARFRGNGSREAAGDCKQRRQGKPRRRSPEQQQPLIDCRYRSRVAPG